MVFAFRQRAPLIFSLRSVCHSILNGYVALVFDGGLLEMSFRRMTKKYTSVERTEVQVKKTGPSARRDVTSLSLTCRRCPLAETGRSRASPDGLAPR